MALVGDSYGDDLLRRRALMERGTRYCFEQVSKVDEATYRQASLLPDWDRATLISHISGNAIALSNLCRWALTGNETPMYSDPSQRISLIKEGAEVPLEVAVERFTETAGILGDLFSEVIATGRDHQIVRTARGREVEVNEIVTMRIKEVWIHAVDLAVGGMFSDFPSELLVAVLEELAPGAPTRLSCPNLEIVAEDLGQTWRYGEEPRGRVAGQGSDLVGWLSGRISGDLLTFDGVSTDIAPWY